MDSTIGFININQNKRVSKLTAIGVVFTPINIVAGIGGMSEFSMMTRAIPWPLAYGGFVLGILGLGAAVYAGLRFMEQRQARKLYEARNRSRRRD
jgi:magnesium transporter